MLNSVSSGEPGGKTLHCESHDAVTKHNTVLFSAQTCVNKTDSSDTSMGDGVGVN